MSPDLEEARKELALALEARRIVIMVLRCSIAYSGRTGSDLGEGERLVILKEDGCVLVHRRTNYQPVNWQPPGCVFQTRIENDELIIKAVRPSPLETLTLRVSRVDFLGSFRLNDEAEFLLHSSEEEMQKAIIAEPSLIEPGLQIVDFEKKVPPGFVDVYGVDSNGNTVVIEIKKDSAGASAVKQLAEYLKYIHAPAGRKLRPIIVAPSLAKGVLPTVKKMGFEFRQLTLQKSLETLERQAKHDQSALKGWFEPKKGS
ncbi:MAG TPA: endonuclease NucS [Candidatus Dormibacteraeota bacterium]|nr:endonuclease NucS [Candidatus Dormibacteraeota bacterium]